MGGRSCSEAHKGGPGGLRSPGTILHDVECHLLARQELTGLWQRLSGPRGREPGAAAPFGLGSGNDPERMAAAGDGNA